MAIIDLRDPRGKYGADFQAAAAILKAFGQVEKDRQERQQMNTLMQGLANGSDLKTIIGQIQSQGPQFSGGLGGIKQRIGSAVMPKGPSQVEGILAQLGLAQAAPQAKAELAATEARTGLTREQAQTERTMRPVQAAGAQARTELTQEQLAEARAMRPGRIEGQQLDIKKARQDLKESRERMRLLRQANTPAAQLYQHYSRMAQMALDTIRFGKMYEGEVSYEDAMEKFKAARTGMDDAWQRVIAEQGGSADLADRPPGGVPDFEANVRRIHKEQGEAAARAYYDRWKDRL